MDSAKNILRSVVPATEHVRDAIVRYSTTSRIRKVGQHSLIRLESDFQAIVDASRAILQVLDDPLLRRHYMMDDRLVDWLSGPEPEMCLDTLRGMERLFNIDHELQAIPGFTRAGFRCQEDNINTAITLFRTNNAHFHFLLTTTIWNYENEVLRQPNIPSTSSTLPSSHSREERVQEQEQLTPTPMKDIETQHQRQEIISQKLDKLLKKLMPVDCSHKHQSTSEIRQSDTCMWLPATDAYKSWREVTRGADTFLWLQGRAGSGKSVLASAVIDDINNTKEDEEFLAYFYCDFRNFWSTGAVDVMCSFLAQLTTHVCAIMTNPEHLLDELLRAAESHVAPFNNPKGVSPYLSKVARLCPRRPVVVLDALDECKQAEPLLEALLMSRDDVRMFVTTRPLRNITQMLSDLPFISMDKMTNELSADILLHVTRELDSRPRLRSFNGIVRDEIRCKLCAKADGMFRWVQCQIDTLDKCTSVSEIRSVLESLPEGLEETYRRILITIDRCKPEARLVRRALVWLVTALRPMRLRELLEAITIDFERRALDPGFTLMDNIDFLQVSRSLVIHHAETDIVTLSHMSVKEYLVGELVLAELPLYHIVLEDAHQRLARLCMGYIMFCLGEINDCRVRSSSATLAENLKHTTSNKSHPLLKYVLSDGFNHLTHLGSGGAGILKDMKTAQGMIIRYAWEWDRMCELVPSVRSGTPWPGSRHDFTMYTLIGFASDALFRTFLNNSVLAPREGINPLIYAAQFGKIDHAKALISLGVDVDHEGLLADKLAVIDSDLDDMNAEELDTGDSDFDAAKLNHSGERKAMPVEVAVDHWNAKMLDLFLEKGSTIPNELLTRVLRVHPHHFPLYIACRLLQTAEFVDWAATHRDNPRLLEAFVQDEENYEPTMGGDELILAVRRLVQVGYAEALLLIAVEKGCVPVVRALLSINGPADSDVSSPSQSRDFVTVVATNGDTPLHAAMRLSNENQCLILTKLLVEAGFSPRDLNGDDKPPIHFAVTRGFVSVVEYLFSQGAPLPKRILFAALQAPVVKRVEMVYMLISKGANAHVLNPNGDALLHVNMRSPDSSVCLEIAKRLVDVGCNPFACNTRSETPFYIAAMQGHHEVVNHLILSSTTSDILLLLQDPTTPASTVCSLVCNTGSLRILPEMEDNVFQAIQQFAHNEDTCLELAKTLICVAGDPFTRGSGSVMLFRIAARRGFNDVMQLVTSQSPTILFTALRYNASIIPILVHKGANVHVREDNGNTLLHVAMSALEETQCLSTTQVLVKAGCDPLALNSSNNQPIHIAVSRGLSKVVQYLLSHSHVFNTSTSFPDLLSTALQCGDRLSMFRSLMDHKDKLSSPTSLHILLRSTDENECLKTTQTLCETGWNTLEPDLVLHIAVTRRLTSVVDYLLSRNMPVPPDILFFVFSSRSSTMFDNENTPIELESVMSLLARKGADINARGPAQNTLLHQAVLIRPESQCLQVTKILIEAGCNASLRDLNGRLPLELAVNQGLPFVVEYLLSRNAPFPPDILVTLFRSTLCCSSAVLRMVSAFVHYGVDVCTSAPSGETILHVALAREWVLSRDSYFNYLVDIVDILVRAGCPTHVRDAKGCTPLKLAMALPQRYSNVREYLRRSPAVPPACNQEEFNGRMDCARKVMEDTSDLNLDFTVIPRQKRCREPEEIIETESRAVHQRTL